MAISLVNAQTFTDKIVREIGFEKKDINNALLLANINGAIDVSGYDGEKIRIEVTRTIKAKTLKRLEQGKKEIQLGVIDRADTIILFVDGSCNAFEKNVENGETWDSSLGWGYNWPDCKGKRCDPGYDYTLDFAVKVPYNVNLILSTVNDGDVTVANMKGGLIANNINGSIKLTNITREASACTINGDVDIEYAKNPDKACRFYTLNGDINAWFQKGLAATMSFESFNGDFYTNVDELESLPVVVEQEKRDNGTKYKINGNRFKIGNGGVLLDFETFNGDVYLKERVN